MSTLESPCHEQHISYGLTLVHPSLRGREAFLTPGAFTYTKITWAFSPTAPQVRVSFRGPLCAHGILGILHGEVRNTHPHQTEWMPLSTILEVGTPILKLPSSMVRHCVYLRSRPLQCMFTWILNHKNMANTLISCLLELSSDKKCEVLNVSVNLG